MSNVLLIFICEKTDYNQKVEADKDGYVTPPTDAVAAKTFYKVLGWREAGAEEDFDFNNPLEAGVEKTVYAVLDINLTVDTTDGAYQVGAAADLVTLKDYVNDGNDCAGKYFKQMQNIAMTDDEFAGIGFYGENASPKIDNIPFSGNYDGQNFKITNVRFNNYKYAGFFNVTEGATIENLTIDVVSKAGKGGAVFVGYAVDSTLRNLTATGTFGTTDKPLTHNGAGIASDVAGVTLIESCTNKASIVLNYTKAGGMVAFEGEKTVISEDLSTTNKIADLTIRNCSNEGTITVTAPGDNYNSIGGLVGWAGYGSTTIEGSRNIGALVLNGSETESETTDAKREARSNTHGAGGLIGVGGGKKFVIVDSVNSGTVTYHKRCAVLPYLALGGIIGNAGSPTIAMTNVVSSGELVVNQDDGCNAEERVGAFIGYAKSTTFAVGGTNVGAAALPSIGKASVTVDGLTYATVSGSEATYVADNTFAAGGTYKVMLAGAAPAFVFAEAGTIAFNTNLCEVANFDNITVADGSDLEIKETAEGGVVTFTAAAAQQGVPVEGDLEPAGQTAKQALDEALTAASVDPVAWAASVYGAGNAVPAAKLNATTPELAAAAAEFNLKVMAAPATVTVENVAEGTGFTFKIVDAGGDSAICPATLAQKLVKYTADVSTAFGASDGNVTVSTPDNVSFTADFTNKATAPKGFMKVDFTK